MHTWVVLAHNSRLGAEHPHTSVVNAYGDRYPWAPCVAQPATRAYLADLAAEAAVRPGARGTELESAGWYGLAHLHAHDKTGGVGLGDAGQYLMSLCFCPHCREGYDTQGLDPDELAAAVRAALEPVWRGSAPSDGGWAGVEKLLGEAYANGTRAWREERARTLQETVVAAVRAAAPEGFRVLLHADPVSYHCGANAGVDPAHILSVADGVVVPCTGGAGLLTPFAEQGRDGAVLAANLTVVSGMGGRPDTLAADAARAEDLGATELRLYHAGLASDGDLARVRAALREGEPGRGRAAGGGRRGPVARFPAPRQRRSARVGTASASRRRPSATAVASRTAPSDGSSSGRATVSTRSAPAASPRTFGAKTRVPAVALTRPSSGPGVPRCTAVRAAISTAGRPRPTAAPDAQATASDGTARTATATPNRATPAAPYLRAPRRRRAGPDRTPATTEPAPWTAYSTPA